MRRRAEDLRVGHRERERAVGLLGEHFSAGRLDVHEYDARCAKAAAAEFGTDLAPLFNDLPAPRPYELTGGPDDDARKIRKAAVVLLGIAVMALLLGIVVKPLWLLAVVALGAALWFSRRHK
jgi:hypothetical protein